MQVRNPLDCGPLCVRVWPHSTQWCSRTFICLQDLHTVNEMRSGWTDRITDEHTGSGQDW